jgi:hypothetical protein
MGSDLSWRFFSLPNAWSAGFVPQSEIIDWGGRNGVWVLMDRHRAPDLIEPSNPNPHPDPNPEHWP